MDMKLYGLPGSVVIIGLVYATGLAIVPAPGNSAQTAAPLQTEAEPSSAAAPINAAMLHARHMQLQRGTGEHEPATGPAPPGKLTFF